MSVKLSIHNAFGYLVDWKLCLPNKPPVNTEIKRAKNFNLLLSFSDRQKLLVKQERLNKEGKAVGEFNNEWQIHQLFSQVSDLQYIRSFTSEALYFDNDDAIIVFNYLDNYRDLSEFYVKENIFPVAIAATIGETIATIHKATLDRHDYRDFLDKDRAIKVSSISRTISSLERIGPEIFGNTPADARKFFALYQRYDSLSKALSKLTATMKPCCLTHNDLKLNNILLHNDYEQILQEQPKDNLVRLIDWERGSWGDPAFDLGTIIASYLQIWLGSLIVGRDIEIEESLRLAMIPLEKLQPSMATLASTYSQNFPEIIARRPDFWRQVVQFAGFSLIGQIKAIIQYRKSFGNTGIYTLQVAKSLLCRPERSITTIFGTTESELNYSDRSLV